MARGADRLTDGARAAEEAGCARRVRGGRGHTLQALSDPAVCAAPSGSACTCPAPPPHPASASCPSPAPLAWSAAPPSPPDSPFPGTAALLLVRQQPRPEHARAAVVASVIVQPQPQRPLPAQVVAPLLLRSSWSAVCSAALTWPPSSWQPSPSARSSPADSFRTGSCNPMLVGQH